MIRRALAAALALAVLPWSAARAKEAGARIAAIDGTEAVAAAVDASEALGESETAPALRANRAAGKKIALTFDDGPHPTLTAPILDLLAKYGVRATFFVIGENAEAHPELVRREIAEGHEIGNHTATHPDLSKLGEDEARDEVIAAGETLRREFGCAPRLLRPPCGAASDGVLRIAADLGYAVVLWSVDTRDWAHTDAARIVGTVRQNVAGGDVVLFHDFVSGEAHTLEALGKLIPALIDEGYEFVTVSELFGE